MLWTLVLGAFASPSLAMQVFHRYEDMAAFNFPVPADTLRPHLNPALTLDLDRDGQAWVSVVSSTLVKTGIDGLPLVYIHIHFPVHSTFVGFSYFPWFPWLFMV